jgi:formate-dependent nitrite reductase membrane component NrfD
MKEDGPGRAGTKPGSTEGTQSSREGTESAWPKPEGTEGAWISRFIDPSLGLLAGEGAQQRVSAVEPPAPAEVWPDLPSRAPAAPEGPTYYDRPALKEPVWIWAVPLYFYVGGTAGAAAVLAGSAQLLGRGRLDGLVRNGRWVAAVGCGLGSALLVHDLGRPERFLHMLRVFRPSSPMSVGSWVLAAAGTAAGGAAIFQGRHGWPGRLGDAAGIAAALLGLPLAGYTAVLLANTAVPLWQGTRRSLPPLFVGSAASGLASLFGLLPAGERERRVVHVFGLAGKAVDLAAMVAVERDARRAGDVGAPLRQGASGALWRAARALTAASLVLSLLPGRSPRRRIAESLTGTAGALALRFAVFHAGKASARDPRAAFRHGRAEGSAGVSTKGPYLT